MTQQRLNELQKLGFTNILKPTIDMTAEAMYEQIDNDADLAVRVLDEVQDEANPYPVNKDNSDLFIENWVEAKAEALHLIQY